LCKLTNFFLTFRVRLKFLVASVVLLLLFYFNNCFLEDNADTDIVYFPSPFEPGRYQAFTSKVSAQPQSAAPVEYHNREQQQNKVNKSPQNSLPDSQERLEATSINSIRGPARTTPSPNYQNAGNPDLSRPSSPTDQNADKRGQNRPNNAFGQNSYTQVPSQNVAGQRGGDQNSRIPADGNPQYFNPQYPQNSPNQGSAQRNPNPYYSNSNTQKPSSSEEQNSGENPLKPPKKNQQTPSTPIYYGNTNGLNQPAGLPNGFRPNNGLGGAFNGITNPNKYSSGATNQNIPYNPQQGSYESEGPKFADYKPITRFAWQLFKVGFDA
jgi:hypothetical protein